MQSPAPLPRSFPWLAVLALALAAFGAYGNSLRGPFIYDDIPAIAQNESIRRLWPLSDVLFPPQDGGVTTSGRPLVALSFALNYAVSGSQVWSYHLANLGLHLAAGLALFGLLRRTWRQPALAARFGPAAEPLAFCSALLWLVHPLNTQAVTYVVQRAESLMGLCVLVALYGFVRATASPAPRRWQALSVLACYAGIASKEIAALIPALLLLYDRTFVAGSFAAAWRQRRGFYLLLATSWVPLFLLLHGTGGNRGGTVGFDIGVPWLRFWLSQFEAVFTYLRLSLWPAPLVFDYGRDLAGSAAGALPYSLVVLPLAALSVWALWRRPAAGFVGAWIFLILLPTSLVPSLVQYIVEHRMYLPLAALCPFLVALLYLGLKNRTWPVAGALALGLLGTTVARNRDYASELALWQHTVAHSPRNAVALTNLGGTLSEAGREPEALACFRRAVAADPRYFEAQFNLGQSLERLGQLDEAATAAAAALALAPSSGEAHLGAANIFLKLGRLDEAAPHYQRALVLRPRLADVHLNYGNLLFAENRVQEALAAFRTAAELEPGLAEARYNWGNALARLGDMPGAAAQFEAALRLNPSYLEAHINLGNTCLARRDFAGAATHYRAALELDAACVPARHNLARALAALGRTGEAAAQYEECLRLEPDNAAVRDELRRLLRR